MVDWHYDRFEIRVDDERSPGNKLLVCELDVAIGLRKDVKCRNKIFASAKLLVAHKCSFQCEMSEAAFVIE